MRDDTGEVDGGATINVQVGRTLDPHVRNCNGLNWLFHKGIIRGRLDTEIFVTEMYEEFGPTMILRFRG